MVAGRNKKELKAQRKRDRNRRELERKKRRRLRAAKSDASLAVDPAHEPQSIPDDAPLFGELFSTSPVPDPASETPEADVPEDPELHAWWDRLSNCDLRERMQMLRQKFAEGIPEDQQEECLEAVFECESELDSADYIAFLEEIRLNHPNIYQAGLHWFMRSRVHHYMRMDEMEKVDQVVIEDAVLMTDTDEAFYGTISMVRLAGRTEAAEVMAEAGFRCMEARQLMPWAQAELNHWAFDTHVRACVAAGATPDAIQQMEAKLTELDASDDDEIVELRREIVSRFARKRDVNWQPNQLTGTTAKARRNYYLLSYDYAGWLASARAIPAISADELRGLLLDSIGRDRLTMKDYLDGLPQRKVDHFLASHLGFMGLDRFHAPASLIAMKHFVDFLHEVGLVKDKSRTKSEQALGSMRSELEHLLKDEWDSFCFLDPLWGKWPNRG